MTLADTFELENILTDTHDNRLKKETGKFFDMGKFLKQGSFLVQK